jgi:methylmalonyl-CoA mutase N-terminal domain/subunit
VVVGLNRFIADEGVKIPTFKVKASTEKRQIQRLKRLRKERDNSAVRERLEALRKAAGEKTNLVEPILKAVKEYATVQEICDVIREVAGEYRSMSGAV